jgi:hypothetical protein
MTWAADVVRRPPITDPRAALVGLTLVMVAGIALRSTVVTALAMGGFAGFSLSGSP